MASGAPPVKWLILRVLSDVPSATIAELTQALSDQGRAVPRRRPGAGRRRRCSAVRSVSGPTKSWSRSPARTRQRPA